MRSSEGEAVASGIQPTPVDAASTTASPPAAVTVSGVTKVFGRGAAAVTALDDVSFEVPEGCFISLLGPSGCGKSTMMRLIAGLHAPTSGGIEVGGRSAEEARRARDFGIVFQSPVLFDWRTVEQNVAMPMEVMGRPKNETRERVEHMLELVGLKDFRKHRPWQLSGGMQQRVAIARALTFGPRYLLMDEPFGALDMMTRERMQTELLAIWANNPGTTVIFITHSISEAVLLSDRIVVMSARPGRVMRLIDVDIPRPRTDAARESQTFVEVEAEIRQLIFSQEHA